VSEASLLVSLAGLCVCLGGWPLLRLAVPSIGFLAFMLPLPHKVEVGLAHPLQSLATTASTYLLQMFGFTATATGNYIEMNGCTLNVEDACSGLGMLVTFFALMTAIAIVLSRPLGDKLIIVASAVPVALIANIIRITATGILSEKGSRAVAATVYHEWAGLFMVPLALALAWVELKIFSHLLVEPPPSETPHESLGLDLGLSAPAPVPIGNVRRRT
jgi:exosortase